MANLQLPLPHSFYERDTLLVAQDLVGCYLHRRLPETLGGGVLVGRITETEGYLGEADDAAHTARGRTKRNQVMFGPPGHAYIYLIYGMWWNLNAVTRPEGTGEGVLIRGIHPISGEEQMRDLRGGRNALGDGPGKLCQAMAITGPFVLAETMDGMIDASITRRPATPLTRQRSSTTASAKAPMRQVPQA